MFTYIRSGIAVLLWDILHRRCVLSLHSHRCASDVAVEEVELLQPGSRCVLLIWTVLVSFLHPPWQDGVFAQRGLHRDKAWNSNSYSTTNLSVSITWEAWERRELGWAGSVTEQECHPPYSVLMGPFWKLMWRQWVLLTGMCQYLPSQCWSLMIIYIAGCRKLDGSWKM